MTHYMIWFLATPLMTVTVLTIGTLAAADLLPHRRHPHKQGASDGPESLPSEPATRTEAQKRGNAADEGGSAPR